LVQAMENLGKREVGKVHSLLLEQTLLPLARLLYFSGFY
jgi:hypothetical protein